MAKTNLQKKNNVSLKNFKRNIVIIFIIAVLLFDIVLTSVISFYAGKAMNDKISMLMSANTYQQAMNVESYFTNIKDTAALFFSDSEYYGYDATSPDMTDIEKLQHEETIMERIQSLGVLENFSDFGVIYANNNTVGWMSESMYEMLANDEIYDFFSNHVTDKNTESGWFSTAKNNYDKIYKAYVACNREEEKTLTSLKDLPWYRFHDNYIFIEPAYKSVGIKKVMDYFHADYKDAVVFGDSGNDISMSPLSVDV